MATEAQTSTRWIDTFLALLGVTSVIHILRVCVWGKRPTEREEDPHWIGDTKLFLESGLEYSASCHLCTHPSVHGKVKPWQAWKLLVSLLLTALGLADPWPSETASMIVPDLPLERQFPPQQWSRLKRHATRATAKDTKKWSAGGGLWMCQNPQCGQGWSSSPRRHDITIQAQRGDGSTIQHRFAASGTRLFYCRECVVDRMGITNFKGLFHVQNDFYVQKKGQDLQDALVAMGFTGEANRDWLCVHCMVNDHGEGLPCTSCKKGTERVPGTALPDTPARGRKRREARPIRFIGNEVPRSEEQGRYKSRRKSRFTLGGTSSSQLHNGLHGHFNTSDEVVCTAMASIQISSMLVVQLHY